MIAKLVETAAKRAVYMSPASKARPIHSIFVVGVNGILAAALLLEVYWVAPSRGPNYEIEPSALSPASRSSSPDTAYSQASQPPPLSFDALFGTPPSAPGIKHAASDEAPSPSQSTPAPVPTVATPTWILLGIYLDADQPQSGSIRRGTALVSEPSTRLTRRLRFSDQWGGWTLSSIDRRTVTFSQGDQKFTLGFVADEPLDTTQPPSLKMEMP